MTTKEIKVKIRKYIYTLEKKIHFISGAMLCYKND